MECVREYQPGRQIIRLGTIWVTWSHSIAALFSRQTKIPCLNQYHSQYRGVPKADRPDEASSYIHTSPIHHPDSFCILLIYALRNGMTGLSGPWRTRWVLFMINLLGFLLYDEVIITLYAVSLVRLGLFCYRESLFLFIVTLNTSAIICFIWSFSFL